MGPAKNTDRELYRENTDLTSEAGSYYENSVHVTESGSIGMNVGGTVIVQPIADWHRAAMRDMPVRALSAPSGDEQGERAHGSRHDGTGQHSGRYRGKAMTDVTDADRQRAVEVLGYSQLSYDEIFADSEPHERALADSIAAALAEERAKARAETMDFVLDQISKGATFGRFEVAE